MSKMQSIQKAIGMPHDFQLRKSCFSLKTVQLSFLLIPALIISSIGLIGCSSSNPEITALSTLGVIKLNQARTSTVSLSSAIVMGTCHRKLATIKIKYNGNMTEIASIPGSALNSSSITCNTDGKFQLDLNLADSGWGYTPPSGNFPLMGTMSTGFSEQLTVFVDFIGNGKNGIHLGAVSATDGSHIFKLRQPTSSAVGAGFRFQLRYR